MSKLNNWFVIQLINRYKIRLTQWRIRFSIIFKNNQNKGENQTGAEAFESLSQKWSDGNK